MRSNGPVGHSSGIARTSKRTVPWLRHRRGPGAEQRARCPSTTAGRTVRPGANSDPDRAPRLKGRPIPGIRKGGHRQGVLSRSYQLDSNCHGSGSDLYISSKYGRSIDTMTISPSATAPAAAGRGGNGGHPRRPSRVRRPRLTASASRGAGPDRRRDQQPAAA